MHFNGKVQWRVDLGWIGQKSINFLMHLFLSTLPNKECYKLIFIEGNPWRTLPYARFFLIGKIENILKAPKRRGSTVHMEYIIHARTKTKNPSPYFKS